MYDPSEKKFEIESKLEKERHNLNLLKETVSKSNQLTKGMVGILSSFEHRLARLEETILPVYNETGNLQRRQENIERTLSALDHVIGFYSVSQEVEPVIRAGPGPIANGGSGLDAFLSAMDKLQAALEYFEKNNSQSVELENVSTIFNSGGDTLNREFKDLLFKHSKPVPAISLLDLVSVDEEPVSDDLPSLNHFPDKVAEELIRIADWLIMHDRDEYMNVYARVRATVLLKSLQQLKEQQRSASGGSIQGVAANSPLMRPKFRHETPSRRASKRLHMFEKKANKMFLKASQTIEQSTGLTIGPRRSGMHLENREDVVEEQEMENYLVCVMALHRLMQSERSLMVGIIPLQHQHQVFEIVIREAMEMVVQDGENIASRAKRCINRHDFAAVLVVFPILKHLLSMRPEFEKTVEGCNINVRSKFSSILNTLHGTGAKALEDFIDSIRNDPSTQLPKDGTVHELTSNVLMFLEQLLDYVDTIGGMLAQDTVYGNALALMQGKNDKNKALLGLYIKKVLVQLNLTLVSKSDLYNDVYLRAVFRLNNNHYVLKALQRSGLLDLVRSSEPECEQSYYDMIKEQKKCYCQSWSKVLNYIWSAEDVPVAVVQAGKLRDKDRSLIKEKFAGFNKEMEEIVRIQRGYSIPDVELRESLKRDNKDYILPKYTAFYEKWTVELGNSHRRRSGSLDFVELRIEEKEIGASGINDTIFKIQWYANIPFTKNPEKYIKYKPTDVSSSIDQFFDVAA